jgi:hypothetical protein
MFDYVKTNVVNDLIEKVNELEQELTNLKMYKNTYTYETGEYYTYSSIGGGGGCSSTMSPSNYPNGTFKGLGRSTNKNPPYYYPDRIPLKKEVPMQVMIDMILDSFGLKVKYIEGKVSKFELVENLDKAK